MPMNLTTVANIIQCVVNSFICGFCLTFHVISMLTLHSNYIAEGVFQHVVCSLFQVGRSLFVLLLQTAQLSTYESNCVVVHVSIMHANKILRIYADRTHLH